MDSDHINNKIMLVALLSLTFVILVVILLHVYARFALRHPLLRSLPSLAPPQEPKSGLDQALINSLPSFLVSQSDGRECVVCLSMMEEDDVARRLPNCDHVFHAECIDRWLTGQSSCPICLSQAAPKLVPLNRERPVRGGPGQLVVVVEGDVGVNNNNNKVNNGIASSSSSSSSFRLSSFRRMLGRERSSSSSRRIQVFGESDLERHSSLIYYIGT